MTTWRLPDEYRSKRAPDHISTGAALAALMIANAKMKSRIEDTEEFFSESVTYKTTNTGELPQPREFTVTTKPKWVYVTQDTHVEESAISEPPVKNKQGRNEPCQCGSGKKFKKCCLRNNL